MPASDAFETASAVGSSGIPKSLPSDMLTTSRWSAVLPSRFGSMAQSIAGMTMFVEPPQPKTRSA